MDAPPAPPLPAHPPGRSRCRSAPPHGQEPPHQPDQPCPLRQADVRGRRQSRRCPRPSPPPAPVNRAFTAFVVASALGLAGCPHTATKRPAGQPLTTTTTVLPTTTVAAPVPSTTTTASAAFGSTDWNQM